MNFIRNIIQQKDWEENIKYFYLYIDLTYFFQEDVNDTITCIIFTICCCAYNFYFLVYKLLYTFLSLRLKNESWYIYKLQENCLNYNMLNAVYLYICGI